MPMDFDYEHAERSYYLHRRWALGTAAILLAAMTAYACDIRGVRSNMRFNPLGSADWIVHSMNYRAH